MQFTRFSWGKIWFGDFALCKRIDILQLCQYRNATNILGLVNQLCQEKLPIEYADVKVFPSHDVQGPEVTVISISNQSQAPDLRALLCLQLQQKLACDPSQVKLIYVSSTEKLARAVASGTMYGNSVTSIDEFQGCETYVGVVFLGMDNNFSQLLEMCSRAQYKLILVISRDNSLLQEISSAQTEMTVLNIEDVEKRPAAPPSLPSLPKVNLVWRLPETAASPDPDSEGDQLLSAEFGNDLPVTVFYANPGKESGEIQKPPAKKSGDSP